MINANVIEDRPYYTFKVYLHGRKQPLELIGLTMTDIDDFNSNCTSKMFVKYGPVIIKSESIDYVIIV